MKMEPSGWQCERKTTQMSSPATFVSLAPFPLMHLGRGSYYLNLSLLELELNFETL